MNDLSKHLIGLFVEEQEKMIELGLFFDKEIIEHLEYFEFNILTKKLIEKELELLDKTLSNKQLIDYIEQFWFANKSGTVLDKNIINHMYLTLPKDIPVGEIYIVYDGDYISYQIVFMPTIHLPLLTSIMFIQNENNENQETINQLIERFDLANIYDSLKSMKIEK